MAKAELLDQADPPAAPVKAEVVSQEQGLALVVQRLAENPNVDVVKLEKIIELQERIMRHNAEAAFNTAFAAMLPKIPTIIERAHTDKTTYAPLEDIVEPLRPILAEFGFSPSFRTEWPDAKTVKVVGILTHTAGHSRHSEFMSAADQTGSKNAIQALASAVSYGKRYTFKDLLCIVTRGEDDDGEKAGRKVAANSPAGYDDWLADLSNVADEGLPRLQDTWNKSKPEYRTHIAQTNMRGWEALKRKAAKVGQK